jgi:hypothetical protein
MANLPVRETHTPTETLMAALSECDTADNCVIILRHKDAISWHDTLNSRSDILGLLDFVRTCIKGKIIAEEIRAEDEEED